MIFFNNCDKAKNLCTKTLIIHGNKDKIVPYTHGRILAKLIPEKYFYDFLTVDNADHNSLLKENKESVFRFINQFISECMVEEIHNKIKFNDCVKYNSGNKNKIEIEKSEDAGLKDNENSENNIFSNEIVKSNTLYNYKLDSMKDAKEYNINNKSNSMYNHQIESINFQIFYLAAVFKTFEQRDQGSGLFAKMEIQSGQFKWSDRFVRDT